MTSKSWTTRNMLLGFEFDKYLIEHPAFAKRIPHGATIILLPERDKELYRKNLSLATKERRAKTPRSIPPLPLTCTARASKALAKSL